MEIIDINNKKREIESIKEIAHEVIDKDGNPVNEQYIEVMIVGKSGRKWKEWYPSVIFKELNPEVNL